MSGPQTIQIEIRSASVAKLENGYTRIANELLEATARYPLTARQHRIVNSVARLTYGYQQRTARLSTQKIAEACDLDPGHARKVIAELLDLRVLFREGGQKGAIGINNHIDEWKFATKSVANKSATFATKSVANTATKSVANLQNTPYKKKENFKEEGKESENPSPTSESGTPYQVILDAYHAKLPMLRRVCKLTPARKQALDAVWRDDLIGSNPAKWNDFFHYIATDCPFLTGKNPGKDGRYFEADLDWLMNPDHLVRIIEGKYEEASSHG